MSWIRISQYLPGDTREIQIWNNAPFESDKGNKVGYYNPETRIWKSKYGEELKFVTHWAEMLGKPEES